MGLESFGLFYGRFFGAYLPVLVFFTKKNLATLDLI
jgi:hypothetical protein